jgi:hypothetical protein
MNMCAEKHVHCSFRRYALRRHWTAWSPSAHFERPILYTKWHVVETSRKQEPNQLVRAIVSLQSPVLPQNKKQKMQIKAHEIAIT